MHKTYRMMNRPNAAPTPALMYVPLFDWPSSGATLLDAAVAVVLEAVEGNTEVGEMPAMARASSLVSVPLSGLVQSLWTPLRVDENWTRKHCGGQKKCGSRIGLESTVVVT